VPQVDFSSDKEVSNATLDVLLTHNQIVMERVICKTFAHYQCDVIITDHQRSLFTNKISRMGGAVHKLGGRGRSMQNEKWKETKWIIHLNESEIVLKSKKHRAENVFVLSQVKKLLC